MLCYYLVFIKRNEEQILRNLFLRLGRYDVADVGDVVLNCPGGPACHGQAQSCPNQPVATAESGRYKSEYICILYVYINVYVYYTCVYIYIYK